MSPHRPEESPSGTRARVSRRILVAGPSGSGKSTLARELARRLPLPYTELDLLFHGPSWTPRPTFEAEVAELAASDAWVTEWQYPAVRELLLSRATLLVCLDYPRWLVMARVVRRTLERRVRRMELWNGNQEPPLRTIFTDDEHIIRWSWSSFRRTREVARRLESDPPPGVQVVRLRSPRAARRWLDTVAPS